MITSNAWNAELVEKSSKRYPLVSCTVVQSAALKRNEKASGAGLKRNTGLTLLPQENSNERITRSTTTLTAKQKRDGMPPTKMMRTSKHSDLKGLSDGLRITLFKPRQTEPSSMQFIGEKLNVQPTAPSVVEQIELKDTTLTIISRWKSSGSVNLVMSPYTILDSAKLDGVMERLGL